MYEHNGVLIDINVEQIIGDVQYPAGWFDDAEKRAELGIEPVTDTAPPSVSDGQIAVRSGAIQDDSGAWLVTWLVRDMTAEEIAASSPTVPQVVTMRQARLVLLGAGLLANVDTAIDSLSSPTKEKARIEWDYSSTVERHRSLVATLGAGLGLTSDQLDTLFITAATL